MEEKKFFHVRSLIEGALYRQLGDLEFSDQCFKEALARHEGIVWVYILYIAIIVVWSSWNVTAQNITE